MKHIIDFGPNFFWGGGGGGGGGKSCICNVLRPRVT